MIERTGGEVRLSFANGRHVDLSIRGRAEHVAYAVAKDDQERPIPGESGYYSADDLVDLLKRIQGLDQFTEDDLKAMRSQQP